MRRRWSDRSSRRVRTLVTQLARSRLVRESGRMRADTHDGPELTLQSEAGYSNARPHQPGRRNLLHRTAGPYSNARPHQPGRRNLLHRTAGPYSWVRLSHLSVLAQRWRPPAEKNAVNFSADISALAGGPARS